MRQCGGPPSAAGARNRTDYDLAVSAKAGQRVSRETTASSIFHHPMREGLHPIRTGSLANLLAPPTGLAGGG